MAGLAIGVVFVRRQHRLADPLLDLRLFADRSFSATPGSMLAFAILGGVKCPYALQPSTTATSIRGDLVTDGPFIEAKEVVAGFYVLAARDLEHALEMAKRDPSARRGGVEVRPLLA